MAGRLAASLASARVVVVAALVPLITRLPLERQRRILEPRRPRRADPVRAGWVEHEVDGLIVAARPLVRPGCLTRGLTHYYFLRRAGVEVELVYGVDPGAQPPEGHCWLVRDGEPYLEATDPTGRFVETYRISPARSRAHA